VQGGEPCDRLAAREREVQVIDVEMNNVEFTGALKQLFQHHDAVRQPIDAMFVQPQGALAARHQGPWSPSHRWQKE